MLLLCWMNLSVLVVSWWNLWGSLFAIWCQLWIIMVLLPPFQFGWLLLHFFLIAVARTSSTMLKNRAESRHPCLVPNFKGTLADFAHWGWCWQWVCHIWSLLCLDMFPLFPLCWEFLTSIGAGFYQMLFLHLLICLCGFILHFIYVVVHIYWFANVVPNLQNLLRHHLGSPWHLHWILFVAYVVLYTVDSFTTWGKGLRVPGSGKSEFNFWLLQNLSCPLVCAGDWFQDTLFTCQNPWVCKSPM